MIKFLDVDVPAVEPGDTVSPIIVIGLLVILVVIIVLFSLKIREKK